MDNVKKKSWDPENMSAAITANKMGGGEYYIPLRSGKAIQRADDDTVRPDPWESFHCPNSRTSHRVVQRRRRLDGELHQIYA